MKLKTESLIFDMDGTLWDSAANVAASWNEELRRNGSNVTFTEQDVKSVMGQTMDAIALKKAGYDAAGLCGVLEKEKMESSIYIMLDTLYYLKKGGRITPAAMSPKRD